jgi:hypothetical protein
MGFVVDYSDSLILFHVLSMDTFQLNGYSVIRSEDVMNYWIFDKHEYWLNRAVRRFELAPIRPEGLSMSSIPKLIASICKRYPLITIHPERKKPGVCYIGSLLSMTEATFTIDDLDGTAGWSGPRRIKFSDATRIDFDGGYEKALFAVAPKQPKRK